MGKPPADLQAAENSWISALCGDYAKVQDRLKAMEPAHGPWSEKSLEAAVEFGLAAERFLLVSYENHAAYLSSNGYPQLKADLDHVLGDLREMLKGLKELLGTPARDSSKCTGIEAAKREAAAFCNGVFAETTRRTGQAWQDWLSEWHRVSFPGLPPRPNVCPYCNQLYGVTHSRAFCPIFHRIIWS